MSEADAPVGSRFTGYEDFLVQDLVLRPHMVRLRRERWLTLDGWTGGRADAGRFALDRHTLCWVHAERLVHKLDTCTERQHAAQQFVRALIWWFYADLKAYRRAPDRPRRAALRARFDRIGRRRTRCATLDRLLACLHANKAELLLALSRPEVPLHTNGSERDLRPQVIRRKVSGGTRSEAGRACRDAFLGLLLTRAKLGVSFLAYLGHRRGLPGAEAPTSPISSGSAQRPPDCQGYCPSYLTSS